MLRIFKSLIDGTMTSETEISDGCWISMIDPTKEELELVSNKFNVDIDDLRAPLDE